jgi:FkbM family methyltransferase
MESSKRSPILSRALVVLVVVALLAALPFPNPLRDAAMALAVAVQIERGRDCSFGETLTVAWHLLRSQEAERAAASAVQLLEKPTEAYERYRAPAGDFWVPVGNRGSLESMFVERQRQPMREQVRAGEVVIDCGANVGLFTREALNAGASRVLAIDPLPQNAECLRRTFACEIAEGRVVVEEKAAWHKADTLDLAAVPQNSEMATLVLEKELERAGVEPQKVPVQAVRIDSMVKERGFAQVDLIKMDIEGAERNALEGAE